MNGPMTEPKAEFKKLLEAIFEDGVVEVNERSALQAYRAHSVLSETDVQRVFARFLESQFDVAMADGKISTHERLLITTIIQELHIPDDAVPVHVRMMLQD